MAFCEIEYLSELDALLIRVESGLSLEGFPSMYDSVLAHPQFKPGTHLIWNATGSSISDISLSNFSLILKHVKKTEHLRVGSASAWVFPRGKNYETACLVNAAFGSVISIKYEIFNNVTEATDWIASLRGNRRDDPPTL